MPDGLNLPTVIILKQRKNPTVAVTKRTLLLMWHQLRTLCTCDGTKLMSKSAPSTLFIVFCLTMGTSGHGQGNIPTRPTQSFCFSNASGGG